MVGAGAGTGPAAIPKHQPGIHRSKQEQEGQRGQHGGSAQRPATRRAPVEDFPPVESQSLVESMKNVLPAAALPTEHVMRPHDEGPESDQFGGVDHRFSQHNRGLVREGRMTSGRRRKAGRIRM
jgi:hypothetical protein